MPFVIKIKNQGDIKEMANKAKELALLEDLPLKWYIGEDGKKGSASDNPACCCVEFRFMSVEDFDWFLRAQSRKSRIAIIEEIRQSVMPNASESPKYIEAFDVKTEELCMWRVVRNPDIADTFFPDP